MQSSTLLRMFWLCLARLFQKRSVIIISERNVGHYHVSGRIQCATILAFALFISWASYSTGSYMSARSLLEEQDVTIRSVAQAQVEHNFALVPAASPQAAPSIQPDAVPVPSLPLLVNKELGGSPPTRLFARIAFLESRVRELKSENEEIVQAIRERTRGKIGDLEAIIGRTGLSLSKLQQADKKAEKTQSSNPAAKEAPSAAQGGPYMPMDAIAGIVEREKVLFDNIERLMLLERIVNALPLGSPMRGAEAKSGFGQRLDPFTGRLAFHSGMDLAGRNQARVYSSAPGKVVSAGRDGAYGLAVDVDHGLGLLTRYGHLSSVSVKAGDSVKRGQLIGQQGNTGRSTGPHLHYEVRYFGKPLNPRNFISQDFADVF